MHTGNGFLLVYSVTDDQTLEELKSIREQILRVYKGKKVNCIISLAGLMENLQIYQ